MFGFVQLMTALFSHPPNSANTRAGRLPFPPAAHSSCPFQPITRQALPCGPPHRCPSSLNKVTVAQTKSQISKPQQGPGVPGLSSTRPQPVHSVLDMSAAAWSPLASNPATRTRYMYVLWCLWVHTIPDKDTCRKTGDRELISDSNPALQHGRTRSGSVEDTRLHWGHGIGLALLHRRNDT